MPTDITYPVTSYSVTLMKGGFGWLELKDGSRSAAYMYFSDQTGEEDRFGAQNTDHPYIVTHLPVHLWSTVIDMLRNERPIYVRGYQSDASQPVTAFFGTSTDEPVGEGEK